MLMRSENTPSSELTETIDAKYLKKVEHRSKKNLEILMSTLAIVGIGSAYWADVETQRTSQLGASIDIDIIGAPATDAGNGSALIYFAGFGLKDADYIAKYQGPVTQQVVDGETWSIDYGNATLSPQAIADEIIDRADERDIDRISIIGHSTGSMIGAKTASIIVDSSNLHIELLEFIAPPDGTSGLEQVSRDRLGALDTLTHQPGAKYSSFIRFALEMGFKQYKYNRGDFFEKIRKFSDTAIEVIDNLQAKRLTSTRLLSDQALAIANINMKDEIINIAESSTIGRRPVIEILNPENDPVVNSKQSSANICEYAKNVSLACFVSDVPGASHNRPDLFEPYMTVMAEDAPYIKFALANEQSLLAIKYLQSPKHIN